MGTAMEVTNEALEVIGRYVRDNLGNWIRDAVVYPAAPPPFDPELRERAVRVEEELKAQRELMKVGFDHVDKRFEEMRADTKAHFEEMRSDVNTRFAEQRADTNRRFDEMHKSGTRWMVFLSAVMGMMTLVLTYGTFFR